MVMGWDLTKHHLYLQILESHQWMEKEDCSLLALLHNLMFHQFEEMLRKGLYKADHNLILYFHRHLHLDNLVLVQKS